MFQTFDDEADGSKGRERVERLRAKLVTEGVDGFIVPRADEHQGEYVPAGAERLAWLTGFTGSAGSAVILADKAAVFVDGRYTLQVRDQVDLDVFTPVAIADETLSAWAERNLPKGARLGYDPRLHTADEVKRLTKAAEKAGAVLVPLAANPLDAVWNDRPPPTRAPVEAQDVAYAGEERGRKLERVQAVLADKPCDALVVSDPHNVCWLFNIRGRDVAHTPLVLAYAIVPREGRAVLYLDPARVPAALREELAAVADIADPEALQPRLRALGEEGARVLIDNATAGVALSDLVEKAGGRPEIAPDPITAMKAVKNPVEIAGTRQAHARDGAAMTRFLAWFASEAPKGSVSEIEAAVALEQFRHDTGALAELSFSTIAGSGPNGAIVHYRVTKRTDRRIGPGELFLIDSGAQYRDGTTDITRTIAVGTPTAEMCDRFTRVLKGHVAIASVLFPKGTSGAQIDALARVPLWQAGLDFDHGTGHGVGSYLSVHEGPQGISKRGTVALEAGMIVSNEPGYYKTGEYGIRIENLVLVEPREVEGAERTMLGFETLTLAPFDRGLIDLPLLSAEEIAWIDGYHARVRAMIGPLVEGAARDWLDQATKPLGT